MGSLPFDIEEYERGNAIALSWHIQDVLALEPESGDLKDALTEDEAREVLRNFERHHEGSQDSMWVDLKYHADLVREKREIPFLVVPELGTAYRMNDGHLECCPMNADGTPDKDNWGDVEPDMVGEEEVTYKGRRQTLYEVFKDIKTRLS